MFTGDSFGDGGKFIVKTLQKENIHGSFFLTGNFYRNKSFKKTIKQLIKNGNYMGSHSDKHILYCDWVKRDSLLVTQKQFTDDLNNAYKELAKWGIEKKQAHYYLPAFEWYNDSVSAWTQNLGLQLVNFTPGTYSNADYTFPEMGKRYFSSTAIMDSILQYEKESTNGLNGFILLVHIGTDPKRTDKFYFKLPELITELKSKGYGFVKIDELL